LGLVRLTLTLPLTLFPSSSRNYGVPVTFSPFPPHALSRCQLAPSLSLSATWVWSYNFTGILPCCPCCLKEGIPTVSQRMQSTLSGSSRSQRSPPRHVPAGSASSADSAMTSQSSAPRSSSSSGRSQSSRTVVVSLLPPSVVLSTCAFRHTGLVSCFSALVYANGAFSVQS
jgi:hypothetical protein